ncbi:MAG: flagellar hook-associated protein FlgL [Phycisphaerae bacterium]|nr:flagellar hook-associated protein FlgL [Phycisphaerae bacterium]
MSGWGAIYNQTQFSLKTWSATLTRLFEQGASGVRILRASDAPSAAYRVLGLRDTQMSIGSYLDNVAEINRRMDNMHANLTEIDDLLTRVRVLVSQASAGTFAPVNRVPVADEVDALLEQAVMFANGNDLGRYYFGGSDTTNPPYKVIRENGKIVRVEYVGSQRNTDVPVAPGVRFAGTLVGDNVFSGKNGGVPTFYGITGVQAGVGTSTVRGDAWLTITHRATSFDAASGLAAGTGSAGGDTILGTHRVTIDAAARTMQLDDGPAIAFDGSETNLKLTNAAGDAVHVDVTGWSGADGAFAVSATGWASLDGGLTRTAITDDGNLAVTDSRTGQILYIDGASVQRAGVEPVRVEGSFDLFGTLIQVRDLLRNDTLSATQQSDLLNLTQGSLIEVFTGITQSLTTLGGRMQALDRLAAGLVMTGDNAKSQADRLQDVDAITLAAELARAQTFYQLTLASSAKLLSLSLLDYI